MKSPWKSPEAAEQAAAIAGVLTEKQILTETVASGIRDLVKVENLRRQAAGRCRVCQPDQQCAHCLAETLESERIAERSLAMAVTCEAWLRSRGLWDEKA